MTMHCACGNEERDCRYPRCHTGERDKKTKSDGSTASYYVLPAGATQLQHLISHRNMNAQTGEIFRACYRYGQASHSDQLRDAKKIKFYAEAEIERLEKLNQVPVLKPGFSDGELKPGPLVLLCPRHQEHYNQGTGCHQCKVEMENV